jgi:hypothetical protein
MRWGQRKSPAERVAAAQAKTNRKAVRQDERHDQMWRNSANDSARAFWVYHAAKKDMKKNGIPALNNSRKYKGKDLKANPKLRQQYMKDFSDAFTKSMNQQSLHQIGLDSTGTKMVKFTYDMSDPQVPKGKIVTIGGTKKKVKHSAIDIPDLPDEIPVTFTFGPNGEIVDVIYDDPVEHSEKVEDFLVGVLAQ